jgi:PAS domain S-box-containing protein
MPDQEHGSSKEDNKLLFDFQDILSQMGEGLIVYDRGLKYREWNKFMENLTGLNKEAVLGKTPFEFFPHLREHGIDRLIERALNGEIVVSQDVPYRIQSTGRSGWVIGTYVPYRDAGGNILGVIGLIRDITERKKTEKDLESRCEENARLNQLMMGREKRIIELKREVDQLLKEAGKPLRYQA